MDAAGLPEVSDGLGVSPPRRGEGVGLLYGLHAAHLDRFRPPFARSGCKKDGLRRQFMAAIALGGSSNDVDEVHPANRSAASS